jgi:hypothetical protein
MKRNKIAWLLAFALGPLMIGFPPLGSIARAQSPCPGGICRPPLVDVFPGDGPTPRFATTPEAPEFVVRLRNVQGRASCYGTGSLVAVEGSRGLVLTCAHTFKEVGTIYYAFQDGARGTGELLECDHETDLAVVAIELDESRMVAELADADPAMGEATHAGGFGGDGIYRGVLGQVLKQGSVLTLSGPPRQGDSGGPVLNAYGQLCGVVRGMNAPDETQATRTYTVRFGPIRRILARCRGAVGGAVQGFVERPRPIQAPSPALPSRGREPESIKDAKPTAACPCADKWAALENRLEKLAAAGRGCQCGPGKVGPAGPAGKPGPPGLPGKDGQGADPSLLERINSRLDALPVDAGGFKLGSGLALALGITGPAGLAIAAGTWLAMRRLRKRFLAPGEHTGGGGPGGPADATFRTA